MKIRLPSRKKLLWILWLQCAALACALIAAWIFDDEMESRELLIAIPYHGGTYFGTFVSKSQVYLGIFGAHQQLPWEIGYSTDYRYSLSFYCLVVFHEQNGLQRFMGDFGAAAITNRPNHEMFRSAHVITFPTWIAVAGSMPGVRHNSIWQP
jgi:hypothetical protein